jgi:hypothetical protein
LGMSENPASTTNRISSYVLLVVFITLALSLVALMFGVAVVAGYYTEVNSNDGYLFLGLGLLGVAASTYVLVETRRRLSKLKIVIPPVTTTIECKKCGEKKVREFQRGDYIFKETEPCQKCNDKMMITAIYREVKEGEKPRVQY